MSNGFWGKNISYLTENCRRIAGGVAAGFGTVFETPFTVPLAAPIFRGNVWDLLITPKFPGRFPAVSFLPEAASKSFEIFSFQV